MFGLMVATRDYVEALMDGALKTILTPNQSSIIQFYFSSIDSFVDTMADLGMYKLMKKCVEIFKVRPRKKKGKKKKFDRTKHDPLSDTSGSDGQERRMFAKPKGKFRSIMNNGWTSGLSREEIAPPPAPADDDSEDSDDDGQGKKNKGTKTPDEDDMNDPASTITVDGDDEEGHKKKKKIEEEEEEEEVKGTLVVCVCVCVCRSFQTEQGMISMPIALHILFSCLVVESHQFASFISFL